MQAGKRSAVRWLLAELSAGLSPGVSNGLLVPPKKLTTPVHANTGSFIPNDRNWTARPSLGE